MLILHLAMNYRHIKLQMYIFIRRNLINAKNVGADAMSYKVLTEAVEQYRTEERSLSGAAAAAGVSPSELASELRSQGVAIRDEDAAAGTTTRY